VLRPQERIDGPAGGREPGAWLWPEVEHAEMGRVRVDGVPARFGRTPWVIERGGPCLGADNERVLGGLLGHDADELQALRDAGVIS
jgi:crotonobetainyl-CoA:carnitine CoA-transferase CaiB-like acyl-CoA transferase